MHLHHRNDFSEIIEESDTLSALVLNFMRQAEISKWAQLRVGETGKGSISLVVQNIWWSFPSIWIQVEQWFWLASTVWASLWTTAPGQQKVTTHHRGYTSQLTCRGTRARRKSMCCRQSTGSESRCLPVPSMSLPARSCHCHHSRQA